MAGEEVADDLWPNNDILLLKSPAQFFVVETWVLDLLYKNGHRLGIRGQPGGPAPQPLLSLLLATGRG